MRPETRPEAVQHNLLHAHHAAAGARLLPPDAPSPLLTYGDVPAEYAAATESAALFDETDRFRVQSAS